MQNVVIKKIDLSRNFAAGVYLSEAQNPNPTTLTHCIRVYSILMAGSLKVFSEGSGVVNR
jgi:hypothetical protein